MTNSTNESNLRKFLPSHYIENPDLINEPKTLISEIMDTFVANTCPICSYVFLSEISDMVSDHMDHATKILAADLGLEAVKND